MAADNAMKKSYFHLEHHYHKRIEFIMKLRCSLLICILFLSNSIEAQGLGVNETINYINQKLLNNPLRMKNSCHEDYQLSVANGMLTVTSTTTISWANYQKIVNKYSMPVRDIDTTYLLAGSANDDYSDHSFIFIYGCKNQDDCVLNDFYATGSTYIPQQGEDLSFYKLHRAWGWTGQPSEKLPYWDYALKHSITIQFGPNDNGRSLLNAFQHLVYLLNNEKGNIPADPNDPFANPVNHNSPQGNVTNKSSVNTNTTTNIATSSSNIIPMIKRGGVYEIPLIINGSLKLNFIFDSGASDVSIPPDVTLTLIRTGTISESDFIGTNTYTFADGTSAKSTTFNIKKINIGNRTIYNVKAYISASVDAPLLLGQSLLSRLGRVTIDYTNNTIVIENK